MDTIIVGIDGSAHAAAALRWAVSEARSRDDTRVVAIMAWDYLNQPHRPGDKGFDPDFDQASADTFLDELMTEMALAGEGSDSVDVEARAVLGLPAQVLLDAADSADLLVVGRRGLGGFKGMLLGSVSQHVVQHARCPVVVHQVHD